MVADGGLARDTEHLAGAALQAFQAGRLQQAEDLCHEILATPPASFRALHLAGAIAAVRGDLRTAAIRLREAVRLNPQSAEARGNLGEVLRRTGEFDKAAEQISEALRLQAKTPQNYDRLGLTRIGQRRYDEAIACFRQAITLNADYVDGWHNLGFALDMRERWTDAIAAYDRALEIDPRRLDTWCNLGASRLKRGDFDDAIAAFRSALAVRPEHRPALIGLANALDRSNDPGSIDILAQIARLSPDDASVQAAYGEALFHQGRFADAGKVFNDAIAHFGYKPELAYGFVQWRRMSPEDEAHIDSMVEALRVADLSPPDRGTLNYAIGKALDDLGQYSRAIAHFDEANRNWRVGREFDRAAHGRTVDDMVAQADRKMIDQLRRFAIPSELPILVVGLPRSGTTLVEQILSRHPEIAAGGEVEFWIHQVETLQFGVRRTTAFEPPGNLASSYVQLLEKSAPGARRVVDKMPHNYAWLGLIHALLPNARIIHCRRHAVDTCLSLYFTRFLNRHHFATDRADLVSYYRDYQRLMDHWRALIPSDRLLEIDYERLISDGDAEIGRMVEFCGLKWSEACARPKTQDSIIRTASAWQARQRIYGSSVGRWRNYEPWLGELRALLPPA